MTTMTSHDVLYAVERLRGIAVRTPLLTSSVVDSFLGRTVVVKAENQQRTGSFKLRGAYNAVAALGETDRDAGVVAASSGNHAQALALAARLLHSTATVVIPADAPTAKVEAIQALGARIHTYDHAKERRDAIVHQLAYQSGLTIVPSSNDHRVIAGAGTVAWEMLQEAPNLAAIVVPVGGEGSLRVRRLPRRPTIHGCRSSALSPSPATTCTARSARAAPCRYRLRPPSPTGCVIPSLRPALSRSSDSW